MVKLKHLQSLQDYYDLPLDEVHKAIRIKRSIPVQRLLFSIEKMYERSHNIHAFEIDLHHFLNDFQKLSFSDKKEQKLLFKKNIKSAFIPAYALDNGFPVEQPENYLLLDILFSLTLENLQYLAYFKTIKNKKDRFDTYRDIAQKENIPYFEQCVINKWQKKEKISEHPYFETDTVFDIEVLKHLCSDYDIENTDIPSCEENIIIIKHIYSIYKIQAFILTLDNILMRKPLKHINIEMKKISNLIFVAAMSYKEDNSTDKEINNQLNIFNNFGFYHLFSEYDSIPFLKKNNFPHSNQTMAYSYHIHKKNRHEIYQKLLHACQYLSEDEKFLFMNNIIISAQKQKLSENINSTGMSINRKRL